MLKQPQKTAFDAEERKLASALILSLEAFLNGDTAMPVQHVLAFLRVVAEEGKGVTEYADEARISKTVMTRHLLDIGERTRDRQPGLGLVYQKRDLHDLRINRTFATPEGKAMFAKMRRALMTVLGR